ncbi:MAG: hypothetical protein WAN46_08540 [Gammaproteobacteria bacterium]
MKKFVFLAPLMLLGGCAAMPPPPEASAPAKPSFTSTELQVAIDQAVVQALAAEQANDIDVDATINRAVEKAVAQAAREMRVLEDERKQLQAAQAGNVDHLTAPPAANTEREAMNTQVSTRVGVTRPMAMHPTVTLKREIRDCALELLMYDTHVADATDACLRIYRSQHLRDRWRNDASTVRTSTVP